MEVCPVCGEQRRNSARFCTTCGHRFATDEIAGDLIPPVSPVVNLDPQDAVDPVISGWPAPATPAAASPWAPTSDDRSGWPAPPPDQQAVSDPSEVTWAEVAATALGAPEHRRPVTAPPAELDTLEDFDTNEDLDLTPAQSAPRNDALLRQRARSLIGELQSVIDGLTGDSSAARDQLASELEISLTRPTALEGEAIADLRAAAEAAQERPRDLDTLTTLTAQAATILALIVGYERATAGIERAIESLGKRPEASDT